MRCVGLLLLIQFAGCFVFCQHTDDGSCIQVEPEAEVGWVESIFLFPLPLTSISGRHQKGDSGSDDLKKICDSSSHTFLETVINEVLDAALKAWQYINKHLETFWVWSCELGGPLTPSSLLPNLPSTEQLFNTVSDFRSAAMDLVSRWWTVSDFLLPVREHLQDVNFPDVRTLLAQMRSFWGEMLKPTYTTVVRWLVGAVLAVSCLPYIFKGGMQIKNGKATKKDLEPARCDTPLIVDSAKVNQIAFSQQSPCPSPRQQNHFPMCEVYDSIKCNCGGRCRPSPSPSPERRHYGMCEVNDGCACNCGGRSPLSGGKKPRRQRSPTKDVWVRMFPNIRTNFDLNDSSENAVIVTPEKVNLDDSDRSWNFSACDVLHIGMPRLNSSFKEQAPGAGVISFTEFAGGDGDGTSDRMSPAKRRRTSLESSSMADMTGSFVDALTDVGDLDISDISTSLSFQHADGLIELGVAIILQKCIQSLRFWLRDRCLKIDPETDLNDNYSSSMLCSKHRNKHRRVRSLSKTSPELDESQYGLGLFEDTDVVCGHVGDALTVGSIEIDPDKNVADIYNSVDIDIYQNACKLHSDCNSNSANANSLDINKNQESDKRKSKHVVCDEISFDNVTETLSKEVEATRESLTGSSTEDDDTQAAHAIGIDMLENVNTHTNDNIDMLLLPNMQGNSQIVEDVVETSEVETQLDTPMSQYVYSKIEDMEHALDVD